MTYELADQFPPFPKIEVGKVPENVDTSGTIGPGPATDKIIKSEHIFSGLKTLHEVDGGYGARSLPKSVHYIRSGASIPR
jgi:hypothetical protein